MMDAKQTTWRDLDTSTADGRRALDIEIAMRMGWTLGEIAGTYVLVRPNDTRIETGYDVERWDIDEAWVMLMSHPPVSRPPRYTEDLNAAMELLYPASERVFVGIKIMPKRLYHSVTLEWEMSNYIGENKSLCVAICLAWLAWKDATDA